MSEAINQCDGCMRGDKADTNDFHRDDLGHAYMKCQSGRYAALSPAPQPDAPTVGSDLDTGLISGALRFLGVASGVQDTEDKESDPQPRSLRRNDMSEAMTKKPPFPNCKYRECDLPGQCIGEGACHHPAAPQPVTMAQVTLSMRPITAAALSPAPQPEEPPGVAELCAMMQELDANSKRLLYANLWKLYDGEPAPSAGVELPDYVQELVDSLESFAKAYPEDIFRPLTDEETAAHPMIITRASAAMGRHVSKWMSEAAAIIAAQARELAEARAERDEAKDQVRLQVIDRTNLQSVINLRDTEVFDLNNALSAAQARLAECERLLRRYRTETPLGHQPHMIAHEVDAAPASSRHGGVE